jgi:hypothetical protein
MVGGRPKKTDATEEGRRYYDIHGLASVELRGTNSTLVQILDRTLSPFRSTGKNADFTLNLGTFPSGGWEPSGSTIGDRMLYDPVSKQTTVFSSQMGNSLKKKEVLYVITGEPRTGTGPVTVNVPDNSKKVGRLRRAAIESLDLEGRRALLALIGDPIFMAERMELEAESVLQTLMEPFLFYRLVARDCSFVHGAGLSLNDSGLLIVGLASVGKTSLALQLVKKGYSYYGDDLPILSKEGELLSNPKPIKLRSQHIELYPELAHVMAQGSNGIERLLLTREFRNHKPKFMKRLPRLSLEDIIEGTKIGSRVPLKTVIFLRRVTGKEFYVDEPGRESLVRDVAADLFLQFPCAPWRHTMYYFCPSVALGNDFMEEEALHHEKIKAILSGAFSRLKIVRLNAPMEYRASDLERYVLQALS